MTRATDRPLHVLDKVITPLTLLIPKVRRAISTLSGFYKAKML